jgi:methyl-accepting chemotaxis protein
MPAGSTQQPSGEKMNSWWGSLSLRNKLQLPIQLVLVVALTFVQREAMDKFESNVIDGTKQKAIVSADGLLNGLNLMMVGGIISDSDLRALAVKKMAASDRVLELRVIRAKQVQDQFGPGLQSEQAVDEMDRAAINTKQIQSSLMQQDGKEALRVVVPFIVSSNFRGTNCLQCHTVQEGSVNGAGSVTMDISAEYAMLKKANYLMWGVQLALQIGLYFGIGWLISFVTRPTRELQLAMQAMQSSGDLSKRVVVRSQDEIGSTAQAFNDLAQSFQVIVSNVEGHAVQVAAAAHMLAKDTADMSQRALQQSEAANATAAVIEQVSVGIAQVAESTSNVARLSCESMEHANRGQQNLQETVQELQSVERTVNDTSMAVTEFIRSSQNITSMTQQVRDIADQTNLLALNAAIEAARAGEQGRGFAVVADEVRKLAEKSAQAATQIDEVTQSLGAQSEQVEKTVQRGLNALHSSQAHIQQVNDLLMETNDSVDGVNRGIAEITVAINLQRDASQQIASNVERIATMASDSNIAVKRTSEAVKSMDKLSENLSKTVGKFKI